MSSLNVYAYPFLVIHITVGNLEFCCLEISDFYHLP